MTQLNTELEVLGLARAVETESIRRYLEFAWQTPELSGKDMFIRLAMDELMHQELIRTMIEDLRLQGSCAPVDVPGSLIEKLVPMLTNPGTRGNERAGVSALTALKTALELETTALKFYREQAEKALTEPVRALFLRLIEMEAAHQQLIQAEIDYIQQTGFWLGFKEFTLEANR